MSSFWYRHHFHRILISNFISNKLVSEYKHHSNLLVLLNFPRYLNRYLLDCSKSLLTHLLHLSFHHKFFFYPKRFKHNHKYYYRYPLRNKLVEHSNNKEELLHYLTKFKPLDMCMLLDYFYQEGSKLDQL